MCRLFGKTKQAFYKKQNRIFTQAAEESIVVEAVKKVRKKMPRLGTRKLYDKLFFEGIIIGRDRLFSLLDRNNLLIRRRRSKVLTTNSKHWFRKYPNLIKGKEVDGPNQLWVSDITYVNTERGFVYLFLITDAYSRKIVGYKVAQNLEAKNAVAALRMALKQAGQPSGQLIHHSDRGIQYCCGQYVKVLKAHNIAISMTENGDPLENPIAERVNGILKTEWLYHRKLSTYHQANSYTAKIIDLYNNERPHSSIDMMTPNQAHSMNGTLRRRWKNYYSVKVEHLE